mgnify:FL=1|tara:strand:+ start:120 stop:266 length:147 start_codon:yes stop_codon:yes gene_type:complete
MKERLKEIWKETIKKHIRRWKALPGIASNTLKKYENNQQYFYNIKESL